MNKKIESVSEIKDAQVKRSIRFKLMSMFVLLIGLPLLVLGYMMFQQNTNMLMDSLENSAKQSVEQTDIIVTNYLKEFDFVTNLLQDDANVQQVISYPDSKAWMIKLFDTVLANDSDIMNAYLGTASKEMILRPEQSLPADYDPTSRLWYKDAMAAQKLIWTAPYKDASTGALVISVAAPVKNTYVNNEPVGVVALDISLDTLAKKVNELKIGKNGYVVVVGPDMRLMAHPNPELIGMPVNFEEAVAEAPDEFKDVKPEVKDAMIQMKPLAEGLAAGEEFISYDAGGKTMYVAAKKNVIGWYLLGSFDKSEISDEINKVLMTLLMIGGISLILALVISFVFSQSLTSHIKKLLGGMERVRKGDLTVQFEVESDDEIGRLAQYFTATVSELGTLVSSIQEISGEVTHSAQNLAATSEEASASADEVGRTVEEIAKGASDQAHDAEKGVRVVQSLSDKFVKLNDRTGMMIEAAHSASSANKEGIRSINTLKDKTKQTDVANERIEAVVTELDNKTQSIGVILDSISAIAVQTNLLALNASIEAARAGEHGRGFAVVAEEIRKLAEESSSSADKIRGIVTNILADSTRSVSSMKEVKVMTREQSDAVEDVNKTFETISQSIVMITGEIETISNFIQELNKDKDQIVQSIENISAVSEETAAASEEVSSSMEQQTIAVEEVAKAAERLNEISVQLNSAAQRFTVQ